MPRAPLNVLLVIALAYKNWYVCTVVPREPEDNKVLSPAWKLGFVGLTKGFDREWTYLKTSIRTNIKK